MVGRSTYQGEVFKFTQAGIEAKTQLSNSWRINNGHFGWETSAGYWQYDAGKSTRGANAWITYIGNTGAKIGGATLNANTYATSSDSVTWQYNASPTAEGTSLWTSSGTPSTPPDVPFI